MKAIIDFIDNYLLDEDDPLIVIKNICNKFIEANTVNVYVSSMTIATECVAKMLILSN